METLALILLVPITLFLFMFGSAVFLIWLAFHPARTLAAVVFLMGLVVFIYNLKGTAI